MSDRDVRHALVTVLGDLYEAAAQPEHRPRILSLTADQLLRNVGLVLSHADSQWLAQELARVQEMCTQLSTAEGLVSLQDAALDGARMGIVRLATDGEVASASEAATRLLERAFAERGASEVTAAWERLDPGATNARVPSETRVRVRGRGDVVLEFMLMPAGMRSALGTRSPHALLISDVSPQPAPAASTIAVALSLTPAEAALVAQLCAGKSVAQAADTLGIRLSTARTQLRSVFGKTETASQTQLLRMVSLLAGSEAAPATAATTAAGNG